MKLKKKTPKIGDLKNCNGLVLGDVHTYHPHTKTDHVVSVLYELVNNFKDFASLDIIIIEGDFFDSLMPYNSIYVKHIETWMTDLYKQCAEHNVAVRVLEGTPSHDMNQSIAFLKVLENSGHEVDLRYIDDIEIEVNKEKGWAIGYVPDEMHSPLSKCYDRMIELLAEHGLQQVDFMVMHGAFNYQFPSYFDVDAYDEQLWLQITRYYIFIGHVHNYSVYERIIATGSTDRFRHGEEKPKGITHFTINDGEGSHRFIKNHRSKIFTTYEVKFVSEKTIRYLMECLDKLPLGSHIRFRTSNRLDANDLIAHFEILFPTIHFTFIIDDVNKDKVKRKQLVYPTFDEFNGEKINITDKTILPLMTQDLESKLEGPKLERALELLNGFINKSSK